MFDRHTATAIPQARPLAAFPESLTAAAEQSDVRVRRLAAERAVDEVLAESFPASDPPSWTLGVATHAPQFASAAVDGIDISRPLRSETTFIEALTSLAAACGIVLLVPFAILLVAVPIALVVRGL